MNRRIENTNPAERKKWMDLNWGYYDDLKNFYQFHTEQERSILEIGCGTGFLLDACKASKGFGLDLSPELAFDAKDKYPRFEFSTWDGKSPLPEAVIAAFPDGIDYIFLVNAMGIWDNVQESLEHLRPLCRPHTRIIANYINFLWAPIFSLAEKLHLKMPQPQVNWFSMQDVKNIFQLSSYRHIKSGYRCLLPKKIPLLSTFLNRYLVRIPPFQWFGCTQFFVARTQDTMERKNLQVSVIIPARNEKGNISSIFEKLEYIAANSKGEKYEVIFVEGRSRDKTAEEIQRLLLETSHSRSFSASFFPQTGEGKGDAVRLGFAKAKGDVLVILDADLTVPPEELLRFVSVYCEGHGEFLNGSRLVYSMEKEAMMPLNLLGNKFFSLAFTWLLEQKFKDTLCGTKMVSRRNYERISEGRVYFGDFDPFGDFDLIFGASKIDLEICEIPIRYRQRTYGQTNISRWKHGWLLLRMCFFALNRIKFVP